MTALPSPLNFSFDWQQLPARLSRCRAEDHEGKLARGLEDIVAQTVGKHPEYESIFHQHAAVDGDFRQWNGRNQRNAGEIP